MRVGDPGEDARIDLLVDRSRRGQEFGVVAIDLRGLGLLLAEGLRRGETGLLPRLGDQLGIAGFGVIEGLVGGEIEAELGLLGLFGGDLAGGLLGVDLGFGLVAGGGHEGLPGFGEPVEVRLLPVGGVRAKLQRGRKLPLLVGEGLHQVAHVAQTLHDVAEGGVECQTLRLGVREHGDQLGSQLGGEDDQDADDPGEAGAGAEGHDEARDVVDHAADPVLQILERPGAFERGLAKVARGARTGCGGARHGLALGLDALDLGLQPVGGTGGLLELRREDIETLRPGDQGRQLVLHVGQRPDGLVERAALVGDTEGVVEGAVRHGGQSGRDSARVTVTREPSGRVRAARGVGLAAAGFPEPAEAESHRGEHRAVEEIDHGVGSGWEAIQSPSALTGPGVPLGRMRKCWRSQALHAVRARALAWSALSGPWTTSPRRRALSGRRASAAGSG